VLAHRPGRTFHAAALPFRGRWIDDAQMEKLFDVPRDLRPTAGERVLPNRLSQPVLDRYQREALWRQG
jgi:spermidine synthase